MPGPIETGGANNGHISCGMVLAQRPAGGAMNYIGPSVVIKGVVSSGEDLTIAGRVEGDVHLDAGELMLAPGSSVVGDLTVPSVIVHGSLQGNVIARVRVDVRPRASVSGSLATPALAVAEGAELHCRVEMPAVSGTRAPQAPQATVLEKAAVAV